MPSPGIFGETPLVSLIDFVAAPSVRSGRPVPCPAFPCPAPGSAAVSLASWLHADAGRPLAVSGGALTVRPARRPGPGVAEFACHIFIPHRPLLVCYLTMNLLAPTSPCALKPARTSAFLAIGCASSRCSVGTRFYTCSKLCPPGKLSVLTSLLSRVINGAVRTRYRTWTAMKLARRVVVLSPGSAQSIPP